MNYAILIEWTTNDDCGADILFLTKDKQKAINKLKEIVKEEKENSWIYDKDKDDLDIIENEDYFECNDIYSYNYTCIRIVKMQEE